LTITALSAGFGFLRSPLPPVLKSKLKLPFHYGTGGLHWAEN
jgi:hypothetical protein